MKSPTEFEKEQFASTDFEVYTSPDFEGDRMSSEMEENKDDLFKDHLEMKRPEEELYFIPAKENVMAKDQPVGYATKTKQEAKQVCGKISRLLRDKRSRTRGSCMFRKRKKRSEKFTIIGYGTQPVDHHPSTDSSSQEESEPSPFTSSDDEIPIYDHPGPNNLLEQDVHLTSSEKVLHHQFKNLAMDAVHMKGKGAKMFAKRKHRMEKFVVENKLNSDESHDSNQQNEMRSHAENDVNANYQEEFQDSDIRSSHTPVTFQNIHATQPSEGRILMSDFRIEDGIERSEIEENDYNQYYRVGSNMHPSHRYNEQENNIPPGEEVFWTKQDSSTDDDSPVPTREKTSFHDNQHGLNITNTGEQSVQQDGSHRLRFRSVKPPIPNVAPPQLSDSNHLAVDINKVERNNNMKSLTKSIKPSGKSWAPVKFQPKQYSEQNSAEGTEKVAYPFPITSNSSQGSIKLTPVWAPKSVHAAASSAKNLSFVKSTNKDPTKKKNQVNQEPNRFSALPSLPSNSDNNEKYEGSGFSAEGSQELAKTHLEDNSTNLENPSLPLKDQQSEVLKANSHITTTQVNLNNRTPCTKAQGISTSKSHDSVQDSDALGDIQNDEAEKPKVAACLKLLDPSKGRYEPKMAVVYKKTNSIGAKLDEDERPLSRNKICEPTHFNKPVKVATELPKTSYIEHFQGIARQRIEESQPLGSIAGELKGKGAKMFEKQQKRMENYTRECNGGKQNIQPSAEYSTCGQIQQIPKRTKENMSNVLGEFRKVSGSDSPKLPSANKKYKSKDPCPYQNYYVSRRLPSAADFVCVDESIDLVSESNNSITSSTPSYDKASCSSSERRLDEEEKDSHVFENRESIAPKLPPKIAPKPKLVQKISSESNSSSAASITGNSSRPMQQKSSNMLKNHADRKDFLSEENSRIDTKDKNMLIFPSHTWSPNQPACNPLSFDHLPPPPSYVEVSKLSQQAPKPTFRASSSTYEAYSPYNATTSNDVSTNEENRASPVHLSFEPEMKKTFNCPKPKFTARASVCTWKPGGAK